LAGKGRHGSIIPGNRIGGYHLYYIRTVVVALNSAERYCTAFALVLAVTVVCIATLEHYGPPPYGRIHGHARFRPRPTLGELQRTTPWVWLWCERCQHHAPLACAVAVIRS